MYKYLRPDKNGHSKFNKVINNMKLLAKKKKGNMGFSFLIRSPADSGNFEKTNVDEIYKAAKLAKNIGCDYFEVKPSYDMNHFLIMHQKKLIKQAKNEITKLEKLKTEDFKILKSVNLNYSLKNQQNIQPKNYHNCLISQLRTLVTPSGVYVCPYFRGRQDMKIGTVNKTSFYDIWHGEKRMKIMNKLDTSIQ